MKTYRNYLNERHVPVGPWCVLELNNPIVEGSELWHNANASKESQDVSDRLISERGTVVAITMREKRGNKRDR